MKETGRTSVKSCAKNFVIFACFVVFLFWGPLAFPEFVLGADWNFVCFLDLSEDLGLFSSLFSDSMSSPEAFFEWFIKLCMMSFGECREDTFTFLFALSVSGKKRCFSCSVTKFCLDSAVESVSRAECGCMQNKKHTIKLWSQGSFCHKHRQWTSVNERVSVVRHFARTPVLPAENPFRNQFHCLQQGTLVTWLIPWLADGMSPTSVEELSFAASSGLSLEAVVPESFPCLTQSGPKKAVRDMFVRESTFREQSSPCPNTHTKPFGSYRRLRRARIWLLYWFRLWDSRLNFLCPSLPWCFEDVHPTLFCRCN